MYEDYVIIEGSHVREFVELNVVFIKPMYINTFKCEKCKKMIQQII